MNLYSSFKDCVKAASSHVIKKKPLQMTGCTERQRKKKSNYAKVKLYKQK